MRVALFHNLPPGGARRAMYELVTRSDPSIEYDLFQLDLGAADRFEHDPQRATQDVAVRCGRVHSTPVPKGVHRRGVPLEIARAVDIVNVDRASRAAAAAIDAGGYDLVLAHHDQLLQAPAILGRVSTPVAYFVQEPRRQTFEYNLARRRRPERGLLPLLARWFDHRVGERDIERARAASALIVNSYHSLEFTYRAYGRYAFTCHLGVDEQVFAPASPPVARDGVVAVGSLHPMKGHEWCIRELGSVTPAQRPPLTVVYERGTPEERAHLERVAQECKVELSFRSGIPDTELAGLYAGAAAVLCAASVEPFGLTSIEAIASGTPVIAVAEGGYREVVVDGVNGLLVDRRTGSMAAAVQRIVDGVVTFEAAQLRASVLPYFSWDQAAHRLDTILEAIASGERMPA